MSHTIEIKVPDIGDFSDVPVIEVLVSVGDRVEAEDSLITLESDKATMEVPSPADGVIKELKVKLDDIVSEGDTVALIEVSNAAETVEENQEPPEQIERPEPSTQEVPASEKSPAAESSQTATKPAVSSESIVQIATDATDIDPSKVPYASPAIRHFACERASRQR